MSQDVPSIRAFEDLFINNPDLDAIRAHLARFNPIKIMGMEGMEIRHSAILAWLMDPQQTHGLGDSFLRAFLSEAARGVEIGAGPSALDIAQADLMDAEVRREWRNIDILVLSQQNGWVFVIENKFHSSQHSNQLQRYMDLVEEALLDGETYRQALGVFLTLWDEEPEDARYAPINYSAICTLLEQQAFSGNVPLAPEVETFLRHYHDIILEATGMNEERTKLEALARQLYREHKRVLDFVIEHGKSTDFMLACDDVFGENISFPQEVEIDGATFIYSNRDAAAVSFLPKAWFECLYDKQFSWPGCERWWAGLPLISWMHLTANADGKGGQIRLYAEVGPLTPHSDRKKLIDAIAEEGGRENSLRIAFQRGATDEGRKFSKFLKRGVFPVDDVYDNDKIADAMRKALKSFMKEFDAIADVLQRVIPEIRKQAGS